MFGDDGPCARGQVILTGIESHICVVQTSSSLDEEGFEVIVVSDATASRILDSEKACLARLNAAGISIVTTEMVIFEWMGQAGTVAFKCIQRDVAAIQVTTIIGRD